jgi:hypothetical protein
MRLIHPAAATTLLLVTALAPAAFAAAEPAAPSLPAEQQLFPVFAWIGPPPEQTTVERYRELRDCGFTHSFTHMPGNDAAAKALDVAREAGVKLALSTADLRHDPEGTVKRFKDHPALGGYFLRDEPSASDFADLAAWAKRIQAVDAEHPCYINLFPNYATPAQLGTADYREHVSRFVAEVPVPFISFDHYPVVAAEGGRVSVRPEWYENLEIIAGAAKAARKPFWAFALSVAHDPYPVATAEHLRLQVYSNLAYGAQGIQYFMYWTAESETWNFHEGPVSADGKRTAVYDRVRAMNEEIQGLRGVFLGAEVLCVGHTGEPPRGTRAYAAASPVKELRTSGSDGAVVSLLSKGDRRFLVVVNRDVNRPMALNVALDGSKPVMQVAKNGEMAGPAGETGDEHKVTLEPGNLSILTWLAN